MCRLSGSLTESKRLHCNWHVLPSARILLSFFFFGQLPSQFAEWNSGYSAKTGHMLGSECDLKMHVQNLGYPIPVQIGSRKTTIFSTTSQLNGNFNGLYLRSGTWYNRASALKWGLLHRLKMSWHQQTANWNSTCIFTHPAIFRKFLHPNSLPGFADGDQQTELNQILPSNGQ